MDKKKIMSLISLLLISIIIFDSVKSAGPTDHTYIADRTIPELPNSYMKEIIVNNRQCFDSCYVATDVTVFYYFSSGFKNRYDASHAWAFQEYFMQQAENDCERACGYGIAFHLVTDSVFHRYFVPDQIKTYYCPNNPCHPLYELRPEAWAIKEHPESYSRLQNSLKVILNNPEMLDKFARSITLTMGGGSGYTQDDVKNDIKRFDEVIGDPEGFYTHAFGIPDIYKSVAYGNRTWGVILLAPGIVLIVLAIKFKKKAFMVLPVIFLILPGGFLLIGGITGITSNIDSEKYLNMCIDLSIKTFTPSGWESRYDLDPTGYAFLSSADSQIFVVWFLIIIGVISLIGIFIYTKLKRRKK